MKAIIFALQAVIFHNVWCLPLSGPALPSRPGLTNAIITEPVINANLATTEIASNMLANDVLSNAVITSANFVPLANMPSNFPLTPMISEIVPSLQYGDVTMTGDLPIGGTIKVSGCFPVYGMVTVDGSVPSAGTAVVADSLCNIADVVTKCANQVVF